MKELREKHEIPNPLTTPPHILEGRKGEPSKWAMPLDMTLRPIVDGEYLIPKTIDFIKRNAQAKKPFFVYLGYSEMHPPVAAHPDFAGKSPNRGGLYADMIAEMDYRVGQVVDAVKEAGIEDNTIIIFSSDNAALDLSGDAGAGGGSNGPWRGDFFTTPFEGSMRVPAIVRWPGSIPASVVTDQMLAAVDWLPTLAALIGASNLVPKDRPIDGVDASEFLLGKSEATGRESYLFFGLDGELMSVKWRYYKMILRYVPGPEVPSINKGFVTPQVPMFFDLSSDPHENFNLWASTMTMGWVMEMPMFHAIGAYEKSVRQYPNIKSGEDFTGYKK
ncbi:MAG TPA: sulfatase-like hydrolase/transferase [Candidatus Cybelea sp.]